jgi:hypothetical protein
MNTSTGLGTWSYIGRLIGFLIQVACAIWCARLGKSKHRGTLGVVLGILLGIVGVVIIASMKPKQRWFDRQGHLHNQP